MIMFTVNAVVAARVVDFKVIAVALVAAFFLETGERRGKGWGRRRGEIQGMKNEGGMKIIKEQKKKKNLSV